MIQSYLLPPSNVVLCTDCGIAISPDGLGRTVSDSRHSLWLQPLSAPSARRLTGTEGARFPFWSPDGRWLAFFLTTRSRKSTSLAPRRHKRSARPAATRARGAVTGSSYLGAPITDSAEWRRPPVIRFLSPDSSRRDAGHVHPVFFPPDGVCYSATFRVTRNGVASTLRRSTRKRQHSSPGRPASPHRSPRSPS